jgi:queuine tRNA-ribosyltransferase
MRFRITKRSSKSNARLGVISTAHGDVETPALVTVATQGTVKALTHDQAADAGARLLIANTFHLHLKPGEAVVKDNGGLHRFSGWKGPFMTDSGGFQVFSLGFGIDHGVGKIGTSPLGEKVARGDKPKQVKITEAGVRFRSPVDGSPVFIGPKESMRIQAALGADIAFAFDECTSPLADRAYTADSLERTKRWARVCLAERDPKQALYGIVQGGKFKELRIDSARDVASLPFDGFGIGGEFGGDKKTMSSMLRWVMKELPEKKPRHLLGIGHPDDIRRVIKEGVDTFDCTAPTHYARHGTAFTRRARLDLNKRVFLTDKRPIDASCACTTCRDHSRAYLCHLLRAKELSALTLLSIHNLTLFHRLVAEARQDIRRGKL